MSLNLRKVSLVFLVFSLLAAAIPTTFAAPTYQDVACDGADYVVQATDWLSKLAEKNYDDVLAYPRIMDATNAAAAIDDSYAVIEDADLIEIGWKLCIEGVEVAISSVEATTEATTDGAAPAAQETDVEATPAPTQEPAEEAPAPTPAPVEETPAPTPEPVEETPAPTPEPVEEAPVEANDIVDIAVADGRFNTLVAAVTAADLVETLKGEGPFTVFAPTDDAFDALPPGTIEGLLGDIPALTDLLLYHVVSGKVMASDVVNLSSATTVQGDDVTITVDGSTVMINDATVILTDIEASNGVIHVVDAVILPPAEEAATPEAPAVEEAPAPELDVVATLAEDGRFTTLLTAIETARLKRVLEGVGPFTVFAPTDDVFESLPLGQFAVLLIDTNSLRQTLLYHVVSGKLMAADVVTLDSARTLQGGNIAITVDGDTVMINGANVTATDIEATNGVIHVIDAFISPN